MTIVNNFLHIYNASQEQCMDRFVDSYFKGAAKFERKEIQRDLVARLNRQKNHVLNENRIEAIPQSPQNELISLIREVGKMEEGAKIKNDFRNRKLWFVGAVIALAAAVALFVLSFFMPPFSPALMLGSFAFFAGAITFSGISLSKQIEYHKELDQIAKTAINGMVFLAQFSTERNHLNKETYSTLDNVIDMRRLLTDKSLMITKALPDYLNRKICELTPG